MGTQRNPFIVNHREPIFTPSSGTQKRKEFLPKNNHQDPMRKLVLDKENTRSTLPHLNRFGLLVQDPHANVYDIPTIQEVRVHNGSRDIIEDTVNKNQRRRADQFQRRAKPRFGDVHHIFLMAGPPYPGPNPRNPALPLDKTVIYP